MSDFPDLTDYGRLKSWLANSKLQTTNNALYQTIFALINSAQNFSKFSQTSYSSVIGNQSVNLIDLINQLINLIDEINGNYVTGPASSVDGDVALFNGTTGKVIKDGGTINESFGYAEIFMMMGA